MAHGRGHALVLVQPSSEFLRTPAVCLTDNEPLARWLVAGLTFQLAADIVQTTVAPSWDEIGRLAAIAAIRTFLTFFLDRDIDTMREFQRRRAAQDDQAKRT